MKIDVLTRQVRQKIVAGNAKVSDAAIQAYYTRTRRASRSPSAVTCSSCLTKTEAEANKAKAALKSGDAGAAVAKKYSIDQASKAQGGKLPGVAKGQQEKSFDDGRLRRQEGRVGAP